MADYALPEGIKNHETYSIEDAARYWAAARYDVPLGIDWREERTKYARQLRLANDELRKHVPIQEEKYLATVTKYERVPDDSWGGYSKISYPAQEQKTREYFHGTDLAAYAKEKGCPGLFGFEEPESPVTNESDSLRADTKEGYLFLIGLLVHAIAEKGGPALRNPSGDPNMAGLLDMMLKTAATLKVPIENGDGFTKTPFNNKVSAALKEIKNRQRGGTLKP